MIRFSPRRVRKDGLTLWNNYLKRDCYVAITEVSWMTPERPAEIEQFWIDNYPGIDTIPAKVAQLEKAGYTSVAHFTLPENCWTEHFYDPQILVQEAFLKEHAGNWSATDFITFQRHEESLYRKYKEYYGYVFYIGRKK